MNLFATMMRRPGFYRLGSRMALTFDKFLRPLYGTKLDALQAWRKRRTLPGKPKQSFTAWWESQGRQ